LVPIFPNWFEAAPPKDVCYLGRRTLVADLKLPGGNLVFSVLEIRSNDPTPDRAMQMSTALSGVPAGFSVTAGTHHRHA
jgi:hypothetical protein